MTRVVQVWLVSLITLCSASFGQESDFLSTLMPSGVTIGMNGEHLREARKTASEVAIPEGSSAPEKNFDLIERLGPATISWYYIRSGVLNGYMRTSKVIATSQDQQQAERDLVIPKIKSDFVKESEEKVLRTDQNLVAVIVNVSRWKPSRGNLELYTVSTSQEITAVVFNPSEMSRETFFASAKLKSELEAQAERINNRLGSHKAPSVKDSLGKSPSEAITTEKKEAASTTPTLSFIHSSSPPTPTEAEHPAPKYVRSDLSGLYALAVIIFGGLGFVLYRSRKQ